MTKIQTYIHAISHAQKAALSLFFVTVAVFFISTSTIKAQTRAPELVIESTKRDFGDVFAGEELVHVFPIRNAWLCSARTRGKIGDDRVKPAFLARAYQNSFVQSERAADNAVPIAVAASRAAPS